MDQNEINHTQQQKIDHLETVIKELEDRLNKVLIRIHEVEDIVLQLNDSSTQPAASTISPKTIKGLEAKITAVEKQLHAAVGEKHKMDVTGNTEPCRIPSLHQLHNHYESTRKRLKFVEDMEGPSKCAKFLL